MTKRRRKSNDKASLSLPKVGSPAGASPAGMPADVEIMNELVAATSRHDKVVSDTLLFDLRARHEPLVLNVLNAENVPAHDRESVSSRVWDTINRVARKNPGSKGAWDSARGFAGGCPFVPLLKRVCRSRARDYHDETKRIRRRERRLAQAAVLFGDRWQSLGGAAVKPQFPRKRGGNLKQFQPPVSYRVLEVGRGMLAEALATISPRQRRALELHAEGLSNEEIADVLATNSATVSRELKAARQSIRHRAEVVAAG